MNAVQPISARARRAAAAPGPAEPNTTERCGASATPAGSDCTPEAVLAQLQRILNSADFDASQRNRRFLRYAVEEVLHGRAGRIKAYSVATTVFGRDSSFDPQTDAIVRIEARRLRRSLDHYYLTAGKADSVRITIPKGSYAARFDAVETAMAATELPEGEAGRRDRHRGAILVMPFEQDGDLPGFPGFTRGFTRQLVVNLTRFSDLLVFGPDNVDPAALRPHLDVDYVLWGGTTIAGEHLGVDVVLTDAATGRNVWAASFRRTPEPVEMMRARDELANHIACILAQPYGAVFTIRACGDPSLRRSASDNFGAPGRLGSGDRR